MARALPRHRSPVLVVQSALLSLFDPLVFVRVGLCVLLLLRQEDLLRGLIHLEHHSWGPGPEFGSISLARLQPSFTPPLVPGFDALLPFSDILCRLRLVLTCLLLLGVFRRFNAFLLAWLCFALFAADGFRYLHHLFILYVSVLFLALPHRAPTEFAHPDELTHSLKTPLSVLTLRAHVQVVYFAAGLAKCTTTWLSGSTLRALHEHAFATGPVMEAALNTFGTPTLAWGACVSELSIPLLLFSKRTRVAAVFVAFGLHAFIEATFLVNTFGATMLVLLGAFLPTREEQRGRGSSTRKGLALALLLACASPLGARLFSTKIGPYTMFTRLSFYKIEMEVDDIPYSRRSLAPHLGRDGARILLLANGRGIGETNLEVLQHSLPELAQFLCKLKPEATSTQVTFSSQRIEGEPSTRESHKATCNPEGATKGVQSSHLIQFPRSQSSCASRNAPTYRALGSKNPSLGGMAASLTRASSGLKSGALREKQSRIFGSF